MSRRAITSSMRSRSVRASSPISSSSPCRSVRADRQQDAVDRLLRAGCVLSRSRKASHSSRSSSSVLQRPAVSSRIASLVIHQSQLRVPPTPRTLPALPGGNLRPELRMAVVLPDADGPIITYQGSTPSASRPLRPSFELLSACDRPAGTRPPWPRSRPARSGRIPSLWLRRLIAQPLLDGGRGLLGAPARVTTSVDAAARRR